jgi:hypothetical protein
MDSELQLLELKDQIDSKVRTDIEKQQRDYFLSQQLKTIQEENISNLIVHVNINGYAAYKEVDQEYLSRRLIAFLPEINLHYTTVEQYSFLKGLNAHYHVMNEENYNEVLNSDND